jgi:tol-pal system protein YbgF
MTGSYKMMMRLSLVVTVFLASAGISHAQQGNQMLEMLQQLTRLEAEVRQLRGQVEQLSHENRRLKSQQNDLYVDLDQRIRAIESAGPATPAGQLSIEPVLTPTPGQFAAPAAAAPTVIQATPSLASPAAPGQAGQAGTGTAPAAPVDPVREQADYKAAFNLLKVGKYKEAIVSFSDFLKKYPSGSYASNAQYWLGEANYVTRQFPMALQEFQKVVTRYPESRKLPDAMLKIGYIYYELKQSDDARRVLTELKQKYPGKTAARLAENRLQRMKLEGR